MKFNLINDARGGLTLQRPDMDDATGVTIRRAFPWSAPQQFISIRSSDGKELVLIENMSDLPANQRSLIESWLARHSFIPKITRIREVKMDFGYQQWRVETDRGPREFRVQEREDVRFLHDGRFSVKDADGNVYELNALEQLDRESRRAIELLL
jgi:hypothetical protein